MLLGFHTLFYYLNFLRCRSFNASKYINAPNKLVHYLNIIQLDITLLIYPSNIDSSVAHHIHVNAIVCEDTWVEIYNETIIIHQGNKS